MVLIFPFENQSQRSDLNWMAEGFADILSTRLAGQNWYALGKAERDGAYTQLGIPLGSPLSLASEYKVAETLGVDWAVVGDFRVDGQRLTAQIQLLDMRKLKLGSSFEATGELADLPDLATRLGWRLLATYDPQFTTSNEENFRRRFPEIRLDAFENYIRGLLATDDQARLRFWTEADRLNPADHRAAFALGKFYFEQKNYPKSTEWLRRLDPGEKNYHESLFLLGVDEFFLGQTEAAEKAFGTLARDIPLNEVSNDFGVMKARQGHYMEALGSLERAYQADSADPDFAFNLSAVLWYLKRYGEATKVLEESVRQSNGDDPETHTFLAALYEKLGDSSGKRRELDLLAQQDASPADPGTLATDFFPQLRLKKNYDGRAFQLLSLTLKHALEERLASEPPARHSEEHLKRGRALLAEGRVLEAQEEFAEAVSLVPGDSEAHLALAQVYEVRGRQREAAAELETALHLKPTAAAHLRLARTYLALGQPELARKHGQGALELEPGSREADQLLDRISHTSATRKTP